jgi:hypothetical protein
MIIDKITVISANQGVDDAYYDKTIREAITIRELYEVVKSKAMGIAKDLELTTQGRARVSVEMGEEEVSGFPFAEIRTNKKIYNQIFCVEEV